MRHALPQECRAYARLLMFCLLSFGFCFFLASCSVSQPFPDRAAYALDPGHPEKSSAGASGLTLRIMPMRIAKPYDSQLFNYKVGLSQFTQDYYAGFIAPPDRLLGAQLIDWINDSGAVQYAAPAGTTLECSANLESQISALYADHTTRQAILEIRIFLISDAPGPTRILLQKAYKESEPLPSLSAGDLIAAWNAAYRRILQQLTTDLAATAIPSRATPTR